MSKFVYLFFILAKESKVEVDFGIGMFLWNVGVVRFLKSFGHTVSLVRHMRVGHGKWKHVFRVLTILRCTSMFLVPSGFSQ